MPSSAQLKLNGLNVDLISVNLAQMKVLDFLIGEGFQVASR